MSPWGKWYLENCAYRPGWWEPFESWRMSWGIDHVVNTWGPIESRMWKRIANHLDKLSSELQHSYRVVGG